MIASLSRPQWMQVALITAAALALYLGFRLLPIGTNLNHMDFRVTGGNAIEFCDPANPQFIPVIAVRSPVSMTLTLETPARAGQPSRVTVRLATSTGKPLAPPDLRIEHTRRLHLLVVDPSLDDYQHLHPEPGQRPGDWVFTFTPRFGGEYRVFADFVPVATGRGLYAGTDFTVEGPLHAAETARPSPSTVERDGVRFRLNVGEGVLRAGVAADLVFSLDRTDGGEVALEPVMDAYAHLVAFDSGRGGFAHLHPMDAGLAQPPDRRQPTLRFKVTIPDPGAYVIWAQVGLGGRDVFVPFWVDVQA
ncbi:MAG: hypothetical protein FJ382_08890 [Verrucomicrobia bacterium]|nr:hypothetical protein [Verrucomicrobiota bacterium]